MNRPRLIRGIKITWSVLCGLAVALLIVLWVRSYSGLDYWRGLPRSMHIHTIDGAIIIFKLPSPVYWRAGTVPMKYIGHHSVLTNPYSGWPTKTGFAIRQERAAPHLRVPFFIPTSVVAVLGTVPWIPRRFSLRTLLIATTLVAIALGLIVAVV